MTTEKKHFTHYKYYPWIVIGLCSSLLFYKYILYVSPSIMVPDLMKKFQVNGAQLGSLAATFFYTYTIMQLFAGVLLDKFGARFIAGSSILVAALGAFLFSMADSLLLATIGRGLMGCGVAFATVTYFKMSATWFRPDQLAFVGGLLATAVMAGAVFGQAPLAWLLGHTNWQFILLFCGILGIVIAILFLLFAFDAHHPVPKEAILQQGHNIPQKFSWDEIKKALKNKQNWLLAVYSGLAFAPLSVLGGLWGNPFLQEAHHLSRSEAAALISLLFIGLGIGSPLLGLLSDQLGKRIGVMKLGVLLSFFALLAIMYVPTSSFWLIGILLFILGFATGAFMLGFTVGAQINSVVLAGTAIALINTGDSVFEAFTEPLLGKLLDLSWNGEMQDGIRHFTAANYHVSFIPLLLYFVAALAILYFIREPRKN